MEHRDSLAPNVATTEYKPDGEALEEAGMVAEYLTNALGDVYAGVIDGMTEEVNPDEWGWLGPRNRPDDRRSIEQLKELPGFKVEISPGDRWIPGPRPERTPLGSKFTDGAAPPADVRSKAGKGDLGYFNRLSDALGYTAKRLLARPQEPNRVRDFVAGRSILLSYAPPPRSGKGQVYVVDDTFAFKIGYTELEVARRVNQLQTGNPRPIRVVAVVKGATPKVERLLHARFAQWQLRGGEWFERDSLEARAREAGGWEAMLRAELPPGDWNIDPYPG